MILVTGATGHLGTTVIDQLLKHTDPKNIAALVRDESKATHLKDKGVSIRLGSFDDVASLDKAMNGVEKVLLISGLDAERFQQHKNVIDAAKRAGVQQLAYTSVSMKDFNNSAIKSLMESHFQTEDYLKASGLSYTILRNTLYMDGITSFAGEHVLETGINLPSASGKVPYALRREMGEAAANALLQAGHENKTYEITGSALYSYGDVARELSDLSGKTVVYNDVDAETFPAHLKELGVPDIGIFIVSGFSADIKNGQYELVGNDLEHLLGRKPASLHDGLKEIFKL